jgi:hypothetical protein
MDSHELIDALSTLGLNPRSYSGRGMYGHECVGASVEDPGDYELPKGWRMDSLGKRYIVYWPDAEWPEGY